MSFSKEQLEELEQHSSSLKNHPVYNQLNKISDIAVFMNHHAFAVWDFMSLLKSLQNEITCVRVPWTPSPYPKDMVRFINEIVLGEECDDDGEGGHCDHFSLYLQAMDEVGADYTKLLDFIDGREVRRLPMDIYQFTKFNLDLVKENKIHKIASAFFYGRENIIPMMFKSIVDSIENYSDRLPKLHYYLVRHIELDGEEHGPMAKKIIDQLCQDDPKKWEEAFEVAKSSLNLRKKLWDCVQRELTSSRPVLTSLDT